MTTSPILVKFAAVDRCDRCGAQAHAAATVKAGSLLFCGHHYREHSEALLLAGADLILDDTLHQVSPHSG